jgi:hypothetical protein
MPPDMRAMIDPYLSPVDMGLRYVLERHGTPLAHIYFPQDGLASTVVALGRDQQAEVGIFGHDGMSGIPVVMGADRAPQDCFMQVAGYGQRISSARLREAMDDLPALRLFFLRYVQAMMMQTAQTAVANVRSLLHERLCRWLLMSHDRLGRDDMALTHEFLALMLGVRRASVTSAVHVLEGRGLIRASRGIICVLDRKGLEAGAKATYGQAEAEYARLIGVSLPAGG